MRDNSKSPFPHPAGAQDTLRQVRMCAMAAKQAELLASIRTQHPILSDTLQLLSTQYEGKLWHQVVQTLEKLFDTAESQTPPLGQTLIRLYDGFISEFSGKLNLLKLAHLASRVSKHYPDLDQRLKFQKSIVSGLESLRHVKSSEPLLYIHMQMAETKLLKGELAACKTLMDSGKEKLEAASDVGGHYPNEDDRLANGRGKNQF